MLAYDDFHDFKITSQILGRAALNVAELLHMNDICHQARRRMPSWIFLVRRTTGARSVADHKSRQLVRGICACEELGRR